MIGLSLSGCILDILNGSVDIRNVHKIIASTRATPNSVDWSWLIDDYCRTDWNRFDRTAIDSVLAALVIEQPRLTNKSHYPLIADGRWAEHESEIVWNDVKGRQKRRFFRVADVDKCRPPQEGA